MKKIIPFLLIVSLFFACVPDEPNPPIFPRPCITTSAVDAPEGFKIRELDVAETGRYFSQIQFVNDDVGFILGTQVTGGRPTVYKTVDGGETWTELSVNAEYVYRQMLFVDEMLGFISLNDTRGCPSNCQNRCLLQKTTDGGQNWTEVEIPNLTGIIHHMEMDQSGNLYANLYFDQGSTLLKSIDQGNTWDTLYHSEELEIRAVTFTLEIFGDKIYAPATDHRIMVVDTAGNFIDMLRPEVGNLYDVQIIDDQTLVVAGDRLVLSKDGGSQWAPIIINRARILHFFSPEKGLTIETISTCPTDVVTNQDVITLTEDGGNTWSPGEISTNLSWNINNAQLLPNGKLMLLLSTGLYEVEEL